VNSGDGNKIINDLFSSETWLTCSFA